MFWRKCTVSTLHFWCFCTIYNIMTICFSLWYQSSDTLFFLLYIWLVHVPKMQQHVFNVILVLIYFLSIFIKNYIICYLILLSTINSSLFHAIKNEFFTGWYQVKINWMMVLICYKGMADFLYNYTLTQKINQC
jgi:hypothetical protein